MTFDNHVKEYRKHIERKMARLQSSFNDKMMKTALNQITRDKHVVMDFCQTERDDKKREKLWSLYRHLSIFVESYDGCNPETRTQPSFYRACNVIWKMMRDQNEGGRKIFLLTTSSPCYGFDTHFYSYQITVKGVTGNSLELMDPYLESLQARCLLGAENHPEPIVPFSPLSTARIESILDATVDPEPVTRDESLVGNIVNEPIHELQNGDGVNMPNPDLTDFVDDGFDRESTGWFDIEAAKLILKAESSAQGKPKTIGYNLFNHTVVWVGVTAITSILSSFMWRQ